MIQIAGQTLKDITNEDRNIQLLSNLAICLSAEVGKPFFQSLVTFLAEMIDAKYAFIGESSIAKPSHIRTIALYAHGKIEDNFEYSLKNSPCENVFGKQLCYYPSNVQEKFPHDHLLREMGIESYIGTPLFDSRKNPTGIIVVMDTKPMSDDAYIKSLFQIFAVRAASELERIRAEEALRQSQEKYSSLFHNFSDAILIHDIKGDIIDVNNKALEQFEYSREEILPLKIYDFMRGDDVKSLIECINRLDNCKIINYETILRRKNGIEFDAEISSSPFNVGDFRLVQSVIRDISDRKKTEIELLRHREKLEELVKERTDDLMRSNKALQDEIQTRKKAEKKLRDYQKQLQALSSQMSLIEEREKRRIASELHDCLGQTLALTKIKLGILNKMAPAGTIKDHVKEILQLIEQTIREARTLTFELSPPILYELGFDKAIKWLIDQFHEKFGLNINLIDDGSEKIFDTNIRFFLFQAVRELLINIVKHARTDYAEIRLVRKNNKLNIIVSDRGAGFQKKLKKKSGFGLFNIKERMNHINGRVKVESAEGRGTRVTLIAPLSQADKRNNNQNRKGADAK